MKQLAATLAIIASTVAGTAVSAAPMRATTRLATCGSEACLLVSGRRPDPDASVSLAGHDVAVRGGSAWHVALPLATLRAWSAPLARSIVVAVEGAGETKAPLPIGLLGRTTELAFLDVSAQH